MKREIDLKRFKIGSEHPLTVICGPCVIENEQHALETAAALKEIFASKGVQFIFKSSYDKANRSSVHSFRGLGLDEGLDILKKVKQTFDLPILTDIHHPEEAAPAAKVADVLQIPAFLCRQTDLLIAAGQTGAVVNIKKGQFLAPWDMIHAIEKVRSTGNTRIIATDRGTMFGYNNLVSDFRSIPIMQEMGVPVCFDATHSVQLPGAQGNQSGGERQFIPLLAKAAVAAGVDCLFIEAHLEPAKAKSDAATVLPIAELPQLLDELLRIYHAVNG